MSMFSGVVVAPFTAKQMHLLWLEILCSVLYVLQLYVPQVSPEHEQIAPWAQAKNCRTVMHPECAGLSGIPEGDWYCSKHKNASSGKGGKAARKAPAKPGKAAADKPKGKAPPAKEPAKLPKKQQHKKERQEKEASLARQSSAEGSAPPPKKKRKLVKAGDLHRQLESKASAPAKDKAPEPAKPAAKKQESKPGKPSLGLKVKLKKAKAP